MMKLFIHTMNMNKFQSNSHHYLSDKETKLFKKRQNNMVPQFINFQKSPPLQARQNRQWLNNSLSMPTTETDNGQRNARSHFRQKSPKSTETGL